jgi:hypothetical protein
VEELCSALLGDETLEQSVAGHPWVSSRDPDVSAILDKPELAFAILIFLAKKDLPLPTALMELLDTDKTDLPVMGRRWWQVLLKAYLFDGSWPHTDDSSEHRDRLAKTLRSKSLLWRRELRLLESRPVKTCLSLCSAKIQACVDIYKHEYEFRGEALRQVVLTDYIRDESVDDQQPPSSPQLGAWPLFQTMVRSVDPPQAERMGLLTGRVAVIHQNLLDGLRKYAENRELTVQPVPSLEGFRKVALTGGRLTRGFTAFLNSGILRVLVGTRSLLGEGWDAPSINSLILSSFVGSFMLTNQMRGRAIRIDKQCPDKASSIWHLVAADPRTPAGLSDLQDLQRRFNTFVGLGVNKAVIENGLDRINLAYVKKGELVSDNFDIENNNAEMIERLKALGLLKQRWAEAIETGAEGRVIPSIKMEKPPSIRAFHFKNTMRYLLWEIFHTFLGGMGLFMQGTQTSDLRAFLWVLVVAAVGGFIITLPKLFKSLILLIRHLPVDGSVRQVALALRDALCAARLIETDRRRLQVLSTQQLDGSWLVSLATGEFYEQALFSDCLGEILGPIENPRYLLTRHERRRFGGSADYHAVPQLLGVKKERAQLLYHAWKKRVGPGKLIYTRTPENRKLLLKARARAFSTAMTHSSERVDRWQ